MVPKFITNHFLLYLPIILKWYYLNIKLDLPSFISNSQI